MYSAGRDRCSRVPKYDSGEREEKGTKKRANLKYNFKIAQIREHEVSIV